MFSSVAYSIDVSLYKKYVSALAENFNTTYKAFIIILFNDLF